MASKLCTFLALTLALWIAVAPAVVAASAASMTVQMTMFNDAGSGDCPGCDDMDEDRGICALSCLNAGLPASISAINAEMPMAAYLPPTAGLESLRGIAPQVDPAPPKPLSLR